VSRLALLFALGPLLALRACAAAGEVMLAMTGGSRRRRPGDRVLAAAARATAQVVAATTVGIVVMLVWMHAGRAWIPLVLAVVVPVLLVVFDLVPRGLAADSPGQLRPVLEPILSGAALVLAPVLALEWTAGRLLGRRGSDVLGALRRIGTWLVSRPGRGPLDVSEAGIVARIARFAGKATGDVMVPQVDVCAVADTASVGEVVALVQERGFSRLPVFHEQLSNTIGVVSSLDLLGVTDPSLPVTAVMRDPLFVPESKSLPELLGTLQAEGRNLACVVDEYGGFIGLVTVEDLVEEIVGEIEDEYDVAREHYRRVAPGIFVVSARARVTEANERFGWNLPQGEYETLGGLVLDRLGRVPKPGDSLQVGRVRLEVIRASARAVHELRVGELRVHRHERATPGGSGAR
jgi:magnesium and cobalt exporter, CNNM family